MSTAKFSFRYKTTALDLWQLSMYGIYGTFLGVINVVFTFAMIVLAVTFWNDSNLFIKMVLALAVSLFTLVQPIAVYLKAKKQVAKVPNEVELSIDDYGVHVKIENKTSDLKWKAIKGISKKPSMLVIMSTTTHGFVLNNTTLGSQRDALYQFVLAKIGAK